MFSECTGAYIVCVRVCVHEHAEILYYSTNKSVLLIESDNKVYKYKWLSRTGNTLCSKCF